jgi:hypothetical protein
MGPGPIGSSKPDHHSSEQDRLARTRAAALALAIETRDPQTYLGRLRLMFTVGGIVVTLAVIAIARPAAHSDDSRSADSHRRRCTPSGAWRAIASITATALAGLGTLLGIASAYLTLILAHSDTLSRLANIPASALISIGTAIPLSR